MFDFKKLLENNHLLKKVDASFNFLNDGLINNMEPDLKKSYEITENLKEEMRTVKHLIQSISNENIDIIKGLKDEIQ